MSHGFCIFALCVWSLQGLESQTGPFAKGFKNYGQDILLVLPLLSTHMSLLMLFTGLHLELSGCIFCWSRLMASMALCFCWASWREVVLNLSTGWWLHLFAAGTTPLWLKVRLSDRWAGASWKIAEELLAFPKSIKIWNVCSSASALLIKINVLAEVVLHLKMILWFCFILYSCFPSIQRETSFFFLLSRIYSSPVTLTRHPSKLQYTSLYIISTCFCVSKYLISLSFLKKKSSRKIL